MVNQIFNKLWNNVNLDFFNLITLIYALWDNKKAWFLGIFSFNFSSFGNDASIFSLSLVQTDELQTIKTQEGKKLIISEKIYDLDGNPIPFKSLTEGKVL